MSPKYLLLIIGLYLLSFSSAITLDLDLNMSANDGTEIYIDTIPIVVSQMEITDGEILLTNPSWINGNLVVNYTGLINWSDGSIKSSEFIRLAADDSYNKVFASNLTALNASVIFNINSCDNVGKIIYKNNTYYRSDYSCSNNQVTINLAELSNEDFLSIEYSCSAMALLGYKIIGIFIGLIIPMSVLYFINRKGWYNINVGDIVVMGVSIIIGTVLFLQSSQLLGASCGPIG